MSESPKPAKLPRVAVLACGVAIVAGGWAVSRRFVAHGITARAERNPATSRAALSELAQLGSSALPALLDAAVSDDREVAQPARAQVESLMDDWALSRPDAYEARCLVLIEGVADREPKLTPSGRAWARRLGDHALRLLNGSRTTVDGGLLAAVERLYTLADQPPQYIDQPLRVRRIGRVELPPAPQVAIRPAPPVRPPITAPTTAPEATTAPEPAPLAAADPTPIASAEPPPLLPAPAAAPIAQPLAKGPASLNWRNPSQAPTSDAPTTSDAPQPQPLPSDATAAGPIPNNAVPTPPELPAEVKTLLAGTPADRLRLVEQLLRGRHENAPTILLRLARDPEPKVRMSAISALGSSTNPQLTEAAYRLAVRDEDPKVARLATELQKLLR